MKSLINRIVDFLDIFKNYLERPYVVTNVIDTGLIIRDDLTNFVGKSTSWFYEHLRQEGVLMENKHYYKVSGTIFYDIKQIASDIRSGSIR